MQVSLRFSIGGDSGLAETTFQVCRQQLMKKLLAGFAADGKATRAISTRFQPALHGFANSQIFVLHTVPHGNTLLVIFACRLADIREIEVENHSAMVDVDGYHKICVEISRIAIEHEIGIEPEIPGAIALARVAGGGVFVG